MSHFKVNLADGYVILDGTQYHVEANGSLSIYRGAASLMFAGNEKKLVAGQKFSPASGNIVFDRAPPIETFPAIATVASFRSSRPCEEPVSPHGNNGVGNGIDPQPPGNPPINDGPGTGPGNPGNNPHHSSTPHQNPGNHHCPPPHQTPIRGNNGVGNGIDPQPPGNPPINDGPGTGPGNPGNNPHHSSADTLNPHPGKQRGGNSID
ncbi:MAG: hypothetical protein ABIR24_02995 [Verrucomicrobiota bacterium]